MLFSGRSLNLRLAFPVISTSSITLVYTSIFHAKRRKCKDRMAFIWYTPTVLTFPSKFVCTKNLTRVYGVRCSELLGLPSFLVFISPHRQGNQCYCCFTSTISTWMLVQPNTYTMICIVCKHGSINRPKGAFACTDRSINL